MRLTGGRLARRTLAAPRGTATRPTTDRVREALFSALASRASLDRARVADLFAGSGALGLEAISRGAAHATFVESHGPTLAVARANAASLDVADACAFVRADVLAWLARPSSTPFDVVFADPPYALDAIPELPALVAPRLAAGSLFVLEHDTRHAFADDPEAVLPLVWTRTYGGTVLSVFERDERWSGRASRDS